MIKSWEEMRKIDISKYLKTRKAKGENGKVVDIPYLPWTACIALLYENGAKKVFYRPLTNANGSSLFMSDKQFEDQYGNTNSCYEIAVEITIDDDVFVWREPVMNGCSPVKDNSLSQQRIGNAQKRAFVKGVAIRTGLGFSLWLNESSENEEIDSPEDNLHYHSLKAIKERLQEEITELMKRDYSAGEIAKFCGFENEEEMRVVFSYFTAINRCERSLIDMLNK